jgi:hypothetical protein
VKQYEEIEASGEQGEWTCKICRDFVATDPSQHPDSNPNQNPPYSKSPKLSWGKMYQKSKIQTKVAR